MGKKRDFAFCRRYIAAVVQRRVLVPLYVLRNGVELSEVVLFKLRITRVKATLFSPNNHNQIWDLISMNMRKY
ncbi:hypothetical protein Lal_00004784 [Lupinus albus]|nr:hypothetical protein Lal_00004784 [Lupinus albus]